MACMMILKRINLLEYFLPNLPPLANDPIPNISTRSTSKQVITVIINKGEDIIFPNLFIRAKSLKGLSDFEHPVQ